MAPKKIQQQRRLKDSLKAAGLPERLAEEVAERVENLMLRRAGQR
jgi:hypothetical protein